MSLSVALNLFMIPLYRSPSLRLSTFPVSWKRSSFYISFFSAPRLLLFLPSPPSHTITLQIFAEADQKTVLPLPQKRELRKTVLAGDAPDGGPTNLRPFSVDPTLRGGGGGGGRHDRRENGGRGTGVGFTHVANGGAGRSGLTFSVLANPSSIPQMGPAGRQAARRGKGRKRRGGFAGVEKREILPRLSAQ